MNNNKKNDLSIYECESCISIDGKKRDYSENTNFSTYLDVILLYYKLN